MPWRSLTCDASPAARAGRGRARSQSAPSGGNGVQKECLCGELHRNRLQHAQLASSYAFNMTEPQPGYLLSGPIFQHFGRFADRDCPHTSAANAPTCANAGTTSGTASDLAASIVIHLNGHRERSWGWGWSHAATAGTAHVSTGSPARQCLSHARSALTVPSSVAPKQTTPHQSILKVQAGALEQT
jgi:hypothetical protein